MFKRKFVPIWVQKRILQYYRQCIREVEVYRNRVHIDNMLANGKTTYNEQTVSNLQKYSFAVGKAAAIEAIMDRLFIQYNDEGRLRELYL